MDSIPYEPGPLEADAAKLRADFLNVIPRMPALARCLCADAQDADDLAYESLYLALARCGERRAPASLLNCCFSVELEVFHSREWRANSPLSDKRRASSPRGRMLRWLVPMRNADAPEALAELASDEREAVVLVDAAGRSVEATAAICRKAPHAVGQLVDQARARLDRVMAVEEAPG